MHEKINQQQGAFKTERSFGFANPVSDWATARGITASRALPTADKCVSLGQPTARLFCAASSREISSTSWDVMPGARCHELAGEPRRPAASSWRTPPWRPHVSARSHALATGPRDGQKPVHIQGVPTGAAWTLKMRPTTTPAGQHIVILITP